MNMFFNENETQFQAGYDYEFFLLHEFGLNSFVIGIMLITLYLKTKKIPSFQNRVTTKLIDVINSLVMIEDDPNYEIFYYYFWMSNECPRI